MKLIKDHKTTQPQELGLFGRSRGEKRGIRDKEQRELQNKGVFFYNIDNWNSDHWKSAKDFDKIFKMARNETEAVEFINEFMSNYDKVRMPITKQMVKDFPEWQQEKVEEEERRNQDNNQNNTGGNYNSGQNNNPNNTNNQNNQSGNSQPPAYQPVQAGVNNKFLVYGVGGLGLLGIGYFAIKKINQVTA